MTTAGDSGEETDESLMIRYQAGDLRAFDTLYRRYSSRIYSYLRKKGGPAVVPGMIDDVFQGVWMKQHQNRHRYDPKYKFSQWIFTITHSEWIDHSRKQKNQMRNVDEVSVDDIASPVETVPSSSAELLGTHFDQLSKDQSQALRLRYGEELEFSEIAQILGKKPGAVRKLVSRSLQALTKHLAKHSKVA